MNVRGRQRGDIGAKRDFGRRAAPFHGKRDFRKSRAPSVGARDFTVERDSVRARIYTRSPSSRGKFGRKGFVHGKSFGRSKGFVHGRNFDKGVGFGHSKRFRHDTSFGHFHKRAFGEVFFFTPAGFYPYYYVPGYPYYGAPYYDSRYYYDRPYSQPYDPPYSPEEPYDRPDESTGEQTDDALRKEYEQLEQERAAEQAQAEEYLRRIAEPFQRGDYGQALSRAEEVIAVRGDSATLGFAYTQALFANGRYEDAADALRRALNVVDLQKQGVFFGEGFYPNPAALQERIAALQQEAERTPGSADLYLLLSYELIAAGRYDEVPAALRNARSYANLGAIELLETIVDGMRRAAPPADY